MAQAGAGFANPELVLINGVYWQSNENRRPILLQAWFAEFADILFRELISKHSSPVRGSNQVARSGAFDTLKHFLIRYDRYLWSLPRTQQIKARDVLLNVKLVRNNGTHKKFQNYTWLKEILEFMKESSYLFLQVPKFHLDPNIDQLIRNRIQDFISGCDKELDNMQTHNNLY